MTFALQDYHREQGRGVRRERLASSELIIIRKVIEHVYDKVVKPIVQNAHSHHAQVEPHQRSSSAPNSMTQTAAYVPTFSVSKAFYKPDISTDELEELIEIYCCDQVSAMRSCNCLKPAFQLCQPHLDLRTVKHFYWRKLNPSSDLVLLYKIAP